MENVAAEGFETMRMSGAAGGRRVCVTRRLPRVMVEGFLSEYLGAEAVVGREMKVLCGFYTGLMVEEDEVVLEEKKKIMGECGDAVGFCGSPEFLRHPLSRCCKVRSLSNTKSPISKVATSTCFLLVENKSSIIICIHFGLHIS
jgi:glycerol-3-phosphate acyltransferase